MIIEFYDDTMQQGYQTRNKSLRSEFEADFIDNDPPAGQSHFGNTSSYWFNIALLKTQDYVY